jgi:DNA-binding NarL/FixJ family response regulator
MSNCRVVLADDHSLVRAGLVALLAGLPGLELVGEANNGEEAVYLIGQVQPDLVLMDIAMPVLNGIEATRQAAKKYPSCRILMLSVHEDNEYVYESLIAGAAGYLLKSGDRSQLEQAISAVLRGELWISAPIARSVLNDVIRKLRTSEPASGQVVGLTPRQREVLQLIAEGLSSKQIARRLHLSAKTVEAHRAQIMERLEIHHVAGLVRYAVRTGLIQP